MADQIQPVKELIADDADEMHVEIRSVPHADQRYDTLGDWYMGWRAFQIVVSRHADWRVIACLAIHELVEALACRYAGVGEQTVDKFDKGFEGADEPGDDPRAPYYEQHQLATAIEIQMVHSLGMTWNYYCEKCEEIK